MSHAPVSNGGMMLFADETVGKTVPFQGDGGFSAIHLAFRPPRAKSDICHWAGTMIWYTDSEIELTVAPISSPLALQLGLQTWTRRSSQA